MTLTYFLNIVPGYPFLTILIWFLVAVAMLYFARYPAHRTIRSLSRVLHNSMRLASRSVLLAEKQVIERNKEVLIAMGREATERVIEREFLRVDAVVKRDLNGYPSLQHKLAEQISRIDEDYRESAEVPPPAPTWVGTVKALTKIPFNGDQTLVNVFKEIQKTIAKQYKNTIDEYRKSTSARHTLLKQMMPYWRKLTQTLDQVGKKITGLQERATVIDKKMEEYEDIRAKTDKAEQMLTASSMTQFVISLLVLLIAFGGAVINFNLIALPMSEMVGGGSYIGQYKTSNVAALVIILVEVAMGLYLMEALRITKLFPVINSLDDKMRRRMVLITFSILLILACVESALAFMRDQIAADMQALRQSLTSTEEVQSTNSLIPTIGQMVMGFILPFALTFVAIPLESFIASSRTVLGIVIAKLLRTFAFLLRLIGNISNFAGELMINLYDVLIFPALWIERHIHKKGHYIDEEPIGETQEFTTINPQERTT